MSLRSLDQITIPAPCEADWEQMIGNDRVRFCEHCNLNVTNLSSLTQQEANRLVTRAQGRLCVRFERRSDGTALTKQIPPPLHQITRRVSRIAASAFTATLSLVTATAQSGSQSSSPHRARAVAQILLPSVGIGSNLSGVVSDPEGAAVSGAQVMLTNLKTDSLFVYVTGDDGAYKFSSVPAGTYRLVANADSFMTLEMSELLLADDADQKIDLELESPELTDFTEISGQPIEVLPATGGVIAFIEPEEPIVKAALNQDLEAIKQLAFSALDINVRDKRTRTTALEQATQTGNLEIVRTLVLAGAKANLKNEAGRTALMHLRPTATADLVRELLSAGAKVNARDESGGTALMNAAYESNYATVKELIDAGASVDPKDADGKDALLFAAENGDPGIAKLLIDAGANAREKSEDGSTALIIAAENGDPKTVKLLISFNPDINARDQNGWSALMFAANVGDDESVEALLNAGADMTYKSKKGETALALARGRSPDSTAKLLESRGAPE